MLHFFSVRKWGDFSVILLLLINLYQVSEEIMKKIRIQIPRDIAAEVLFFSKKNRGTVVLCLVMS